MGDMQTSFVMVKPDGVQRGLVGEIISRFERKGLRLVGMRQLIPSEELAATHYEVHKERPFYAGLIEFITSGPVVAMAWRGRDAISSSARPTAVLPPEAPSEGTSRSKSARTSCTAATGRRRRSSNSGCGSPKARSIGNESQRNGSTSEHAAGSIEFQRGR